MWVSPQGNLYLSTLVRVRPADPPAPALALVAAVALHEVLSTMCHPRERGGPDLISPDASPEVLGPRFRGDEIKVKWPNDLMTAGAKLAGILLERAGDAVVIGFGANLAHAPEGLGRPATSLAKLTGTAPDPAAAAEHLTHCFADWLARWRMEGLEPVRTAWLAAAHPIGTRLSTPEGEGAFEGLDENGALRLRLPGGTIRLVHAGDVFLI